MAPAVDAVVARALAKDPRERYQSAPALAAALQQAVAPRPADTLRATADEIERRLIEVRRRQLPGKVQLVEQLARELAERRREAAG